MSLECWIFSHFIWSHLIACNAICRRWVPKRNRTTRKNVGKETHELSVPLQSVETELQSTLELITRKNVAKTTPELSSTAILTDWLANHIRTTCKNVNKTTPELAVPLRGRFENDPGRTERVPHPSAGQASPHIIRDTFCLAKHCIFFASAISQKRISCVTSFNFQVFKLWKRSFRARSSFKFQVFMLWNRSFRARPSFKFHVFKLWKRSFRSRPSFTLKVEDVTTKL